MSQNLISAQLSDDAVIDISKHLEAIQSLMPFLTDLNADDRRKLLIMGSGSVGFTNDAVELSQQHSDILPRSFDVDELQRDRTLFNQMLRVQNSVDYLKNLIDDTTLAVGSDLYQGSLEVYTYAKAAGKGSGLEERVKEMGKRFGKRRRAVKAEEMSEA